MADAEQVTSQTPATKQKNPKRVAAGKAVAERTRLAREAQKKAFAEAQVIIANDWQKRVPDRPVPDQPVPDRPVPGPPVPDEPVPESAKITATQWLSVISIIVSLVGIYYKREEIKSVFSKKAPVEMPPRAPPPSPATTKRGVLKMD